MLPIIRQLEKSLDPWAGNARRNGLDRVFEDIWPSNVFAGRNFGNLDLYEDEQNIHIDVELPGCQSKDIELTLEDGVLHMHAQRTHETENKEANYYVRERAAGQWSRSVRLPEAVQENKINATFKDGVLKVTLEKEEKSKPRKIEIK